MRYIKYCIIPSHLGGDLIISKHVKLKGDVGKVATRLSTITAIQVLNGLMKNAALGGKHFSLLTTHFSQLSHSSKPNYYPKRNKYLCRSCSNTTPSLVNITQPPKRSTKHPFPTPNPQALPFFHAPSLTIPILSVHMVLILPS